MNDEFPPMIATDAVVRETQALIQRYRLLRRLTDGNGIRKDLRDAEPEPNLVAEMERQLVPGVDAPLLGSTAAWPIPCGVRLEALYASRWLKDSPALVGCYKIPRTAEEFAEMFQARTGIAPDSNAMQSNFRITPRKLGIVFEQICGPAEAPSVNGLMLLRGGPCCLNRLAVWISGSPLVDHAAARSGWPKYTWSGVLAPSAECGRTLL